MKVFHIRTGDAGPARIIDNWIVAHALDCRSVDDPYRACSLLVTAPQSLPEIVFIGLDHLRIDERRLVAYVRETWPGATIVTYGGTIDIPTVPGSKVHCESAAAVERLLGVGALRDVVRCISVSRTSHDPSPPRTPATPDVVERRPPIDLPPPRTGSTDRPGPSNPTVTGGLSPREIAALLGGSAG